MSPELVLLSLRVGLAVTLYAILLTVLSYQRKDLKAVLSFPKTVPAAQLLTVDDQNHFPLYASNIIGRSWESSVRIADETVSSTHARISYQAGQWWLEDLGSRNGTMLNDIPVDSPLVITYGDLIKFGRVEMQLEGGMTTLSQLGQAKEH